MLTHAHIHSCALTIPAERGVENTTARRFKDSEATTFLAVIFVARTCNLAQTADAAETNVHGEEEEETKEGDKRSAFGMSPAFRIATPDSPPDG